MNGGFQGVLRSETASSLLSVIEEVEGDPMALRITRIHTNLSMNNVSIRALIPSGSVQLVSEGHGAVFVIFVEELNRNHGGSGTSGRMLQLSVLSRMFWYDIKASSFHTFLR